jgi:nucleoid-associated protein YgaU
MRSNRLWLAGVVALILAFGPARPVAAQNPPPQTHTVNRGDTLWDLARQYFGDPFLWPEIYRLNTLVVEDPHWIYPGEVLRLVAEGPVSSVPAADTSAVAAPAPAEAAAAAVAEVPAAVAAQPADSAAAAEAEAMAVEPEPEVADTAEPVFPKAYAPSPREAFKDYVEQKYHPLRRSEFYNSGFLTDDQPLPLGQLLGPTEPEAVASLSYNFTAHLFSKVAVIPPGGATYQVGDTLLAVRTDRSIQGHGRIVKPTGLLRVIDVSKKENVAEVIAEYGRIQQGQSVLPVEHFVDKGDVKAVPISDGVEGTVIGYRDVQDIASLMTVLFIDKGRKEGVATGDIFELRRGVEKIQDGPNTLPEVIAHIQIVHVRDHTATGRVTVLVSPDIVRGTKVRQIAKLPS